MLLLSSSCAKSSSDEEDARDAMKPKTRMIGPKACFDLVADLLEECGAAAEIKRGLPLARSTFMFSSY